MTRSIPRVAALLALAALLPLVTGCGAKLVPVTGVVTLDDKPVAGASVTFTTEDGKNISTGVTDDSGNFTLEHQKGPGAYPGEYKVVVVKYPKVEGPVVSPALAGDTSGKIDKDYEKQMKKEIDSSKAVAPKAPPGMKMPPGMMMPGGGVGASGKKSELPDVYGVLDKTPLKVTIPAGDGVKLQLKSKP